jgi:hypothetical protein
MAPGSGRLYVQAMNEAPNIATLRARRVEVRQRLADFDARRINLTAGEIHELHGEIAEITELLSELGDADT